MVAAHEANALFLIQMNGNNPWQFYESIANKGKWYIMLIVEGVNVDRSAYAQIHNMRIDYPEEALGSSGIM